MTPSSENVVAPTALGPAIATDLVVDPSILSYLDGISLVTIAPTEFGGAYYDAATDRAIVFYSTAVDPAVADVDIHRYVAESITWLNQSVVDGNNAPVTTAIDPPLALVLVASDMTYKDYADLGRRANTENWTTDAPTRVVGYGPNYATQQEDVMIVDLSRTDIDAATTTFGQRIHLIDSGIPHAVSTQSSVVPSSSTAG